MYDPSCHVNPARTGRSAMMDVEVWTVARTAAPDTRERVLETAADLFYARGIRAVGMQEIVDTVGCGKSLLYREFPSKTDLVMAYLEREWRNWQRRAAEASWAAGSDPAAQLVALVQANVDQVHDKTYRGCPLRNYLAEFSDPDDPCVTAALEHLRVDRARVEALVKQFRPGDHRVITERIWLIIEGLLSAAARPGGARTVKAAVPFVKDVLARSA
jgi:AcrR family transcriptional regulator